MIHAFQKLGDPFCELIGSMAFSMHFLEPKKLLLCSPCSKQDCWAVLNKSSLSCPRSSCWLTPCPQQEPQIKIQYLSHTAFRKKKKNDNSSMAYTIYTIYTIPCVKIIVIVMSPNQTLRVRFTSPIVTRYSFYRCCWYLSMIEIHHPLSVFHSRDLHFKHIFTLCSHPCTGQISASSKTKQKKVKRSNHSFRCFF